MDRLMGLLSKALSQQSSYAAKKNGLWEDLMERLSDCALPQDVDAVERHIETLALQIPAAWDEPLREIIEKRREEIAADDITLIMRERFDF
jgi:hypothetical protein